MAHFDADGAGAIHTIPFWLFDNWGVIAGVYFFLVPDIARVDRIFKNGVYVSKLTFGTPSKKSLVSLANNSF